MKPGDMWNWTWALLGVLLVYTLATSAALHALDAPKIAFGFAAFGCIFQTGLISLLALTVYGAFTKRWYPLAAAFLAPLILFPCMIVFLIVTSLIDYVWFSLLHLPKPPQIAYLAWGILLPAVPLVLAFARNPKEREKQEDANKELNPTNEPAAGGSI